MNLFDDFISLTSIDECKPDLSPFAWCNSDWILGDESRLDNSTVRDRCVAWFQRIPEGKQASLRRKFRSKDDTHHNGAFFELFLHELFTVLGCGVEFEPSIGGKTPDFLLTTVEASTIVEATVAGHSSNPLDLGPNEQEVVDAIRQLRSPNFSLLFDIEETGNSTPTRATPSKEYAIRVVRKLLAENNPAVVRGTVEQYGRRAAPSARIEWSKRVMTVWLSPKNPNTGETGGSDRIAIARMNAKRINPACSMQKALEEKTKDYKGLNVPLIVALNAADRFFSLDGDALNILWGDSHFWYQMDAHDPSEYPLLGNKFWSRDRASNVAGVLIFRNADILNMTQSYATLYLNPHYRGPALPNALMRFPHYMGGTPVRYEGENVGQLLGLSFK